MIRRYIIWRNKNAADEDLRKVVTQGQRRLNGDLLANPWNRDPAEHAEGHCREATDAWSRSPDVIPDDVIHSYNETLKSLIIDLSEWTDRAIIPLSPAALQVHTEWHAEIEPRLRSGDLESLRDWASKLPGTTARLAGLLHLAENPKNGVRMSIHEDTMRRAVDLARYFAEHTMVAFGVMRAHPALDDARSVLEWIGERTGFKQREVQRALHRWFETVDGVA